MIRDAFCTILILEAARAFYFLTMYFKYIFIIMQKYLQYYIHLYVKKVVLYML